MTNNTEKSSYLSSNLQIEHWSTDTHPETATNNYAVYGGDQEGEITRSSTDWWQSLNTGAV